MVGLGGSGLRIAPFFYVVGVVVVAVGSLVQSRILAEREDQWREWAERGTAGDRPSGLAPQVPSGSAAEAPQARHESPAAPGMPQ